MKLKNEAHEALSLLFQQEGVPAAIIYDNAKEMILGKFSRKFKAALCHLRKIEKFTKWWNAEKKINEPKGGYGRKLIKSGTKKILWDDCLDLESYIRSNN